MGRMGRQVRLAAAMSVVVAVGVVLLMAWAWALPPQRPPAWVLVVVAIAGMVACNLATVWLLARPWAGLPEILARLLIPSAEEAPDVPPAPRSLVPWRSGRDPVEAFASRASRTTARLAVLAPRLASLADQMRARGDAWARCRAAAGSPARRLTAMAEAWGSQLVPSPPPAEAAPRPPPQSPAGRGQRALGDLEQALAAARTRAHRAPAPAPADLREASGELGQALGTAAMMLGHAGEVLRALDDAVAQAHRAAGSPVGPVAAAAAALRPAHQALSQALARAAGLADQLGRSTTAPQPSPTLDVGPLDEALARAQQAGHALAFELRERAAAAPAPAPPPHVRLPEGWTQELIATMANVADVHGETDAHLAGVWSVVTEVGSLAAGIIEILGGPQASLARTRPAPQQLPTLCAVGAGASSGPVA